MDVENAKMLLSYHSGRNSDIHNPKWGNGFLGSLRPFGGELRQENFIEVMECMRALKGEFGEKKIDKDILSDIVSITYLARTWVSSDGMLGRNKLMTEEQIQTLVIWADIIEECLMYLLDDAEEEAFFSYEEYLDGRYR